MGIARRRWARISWIAGGLALAGVLGAVAIRQDRFDPRQSELLWSWLERISWLAAVAGLIVAFAATRRATAGQTAPVSAPVEAVADPVVRNLPPRNLAFLGRDEELREIGEGLNEHSSLVIQALHGWGGVGKTQLAIEYAHRHTPGYDVIWWFAAEQPQLLRDQYAQLAVAAGVATPETDAAIALTLARRYLRERSRWLLVFDNAEDPATLRDWLPDGDGHVLITSRRRDWHELAEPISVDVFTRADSVAMLSRGATMDRVDVQNLARELGDLPLALAQAAGFIAETGMSARDYLAGVEERADLVFAEGPPPSYPASLAATVAAAAQRAAESDEAALQLLHLAAICGPEPVPLWLFAGAPVAEPLASVAAEPLGLRRSVGLLVRLGLVRTDGESILLHRLTRKILSSSETGAAVDENRRTVEHLLITGRPADTTDPAHWLRWSGLAPHILALDPSNSDSPEFRNLASEWVLHLLHRGNLTEGLTFAEHFHEVWAGRHGPEERTVLQAAYVLGYAYYAVGRWPEAKAIDERTHQARLRILGPDSQDTQNSANNLAESLARLGDVDAGVALYREIVARQRRLHGDDHPSTMQFAGNLAARLRSIGEMEAARTLSEQVWEQRRRISGENHLSTLIQAWSVGVNLRILGDLTASKEILEDTLIRSRKALGENHPETLRCAYFFALTLTDLGRIPEARRLVEDVLKRRRVLLGEEHPDTRRAAEFLEDPRRG
jgi:tetratricopeptide (TPR) repeat protein